MSEQEDAATAEKDGVGPRVLSAAAKRALAEAQARHEAAAAREQAEKEIGGRKGPDPARYGDWEVKGIACDF